MKKQKFVLLLFIVILIIAGGIIIYNNRPTGKNEIKNNNENQQAPEEKWLEYHNTSRNFSLRYPQELKIKEYDEGDGTYTIVFEDAANEKSFQIFFTPYWGDTITQSRILKDVPSGKFSEPVEILTGNNIRTLAFISEGSLGKMREVWFIRGGFLYEVTTYASLDSWLAQILSTWHFN